MRKPAVNYAKWEKTYQLKVTPEVLMEAVSKETGKDDSFAPFSYVAAWFRAEEKDYLAWADATNLTIRRIGSRRWALLNGTLRPSRTGWKLEARIECPQWWIPHAILIFALTIFSCAGIMTAYGAIHSPSQGTDSSDMTWVLWILGPLFWVIVTSTMRYAMRQESELLVAFFEKLVAPYAVAADTIPRDADARDP